MMKRSNEATVIATTPPDLIASSGGLKNFSGGNDAMTGPGRFAAAHNVTLLAPTSWPPASLKACCSAAR